MLKLDIPALLKQEFATVETQHQGTSRDLRKNARRSDKQEIAELFAIHGPVIPDFGPSWKRSATDIPADRSTESRHGEREIVLLR